MQKRPTDVWLVNWLMYKDIDGSQYVCRLRKRHQEGGVVVLYKKELHDRVHVVRKDVDACYMWVRLN